MESTICKQRTPKPIVITLASIKPELHVALHCCHIPPRVLLESVINENYLTCFLLRIRVFWETSGSLQRT